MGKSAPKAQPTPPPPAPDRDAAASTAARGDRNAKRRGYGSTILGNRQNTLAERNPLNTLLGG